MTGAVEPFSYLSIAQAESVRTDRCVAYVWRPAKGVVVTRIEGYFAEEAAALIDARVRANVAEDGFLLGIHDWAEVDDYATGTRVRMTNTGQDMRALTKGVHILVRSKIVAMAVQTANLVLRNVTAYTDRSLWERFLASTLRGH